MISMVDYLWQGWSSSHTNNTLINYHPYYNKVFPFIKRVLGFNIVVGMASIYATTNSLPSPSTNIVPRPNMLQFLCKWNGLPLMGCLNIDVKVKQTLSSWKIFSCSSFHCHAWCTFINLAKGLAMTLNPMTNMR